MNTSNITLLHQEPTALLTTYESKLKILQLFERLTSFTIDAISLFFFKNDRSKFDPHVGETLCQIRAYRVLILSTQIDKGIIEKKQIELLKLKAIFKRIKIEIEALRKTWNLNEKSKRLLSSSVSLHSFIQNKYLEIDLSASTLYLMKAYFLTHFKKTSCNGDTYIDHELICKDLNITRKLSKKLVRYYQLGLAQDTTPFIFGLSSNLDQQNDNVGALIKNMRRFDDDDREVLPCYLATKIILSDMRMKRNNILLIVERQQEGVTYDYISVLFVSTEEGVFKAKSFNELSPQTPVFVINGISEKTRNEDKHEFIGRLLGVGFINLVLLNMAHHPQYSGCKLNQVSFDPFQQLLNQKYQDLANLDSNDVNYFVEYERIYTEINIAEAGQYELLKMKKISENIGCCEKNKSLFFIRHIFCDIFQNQFNHIHYLNRSKGSPVRNNYLELTEQ